MSKIRRLTKHLIASVTRVKEYIDEHPLENKSTDELADLGGVGRNMLQGAFRELFGMKIKGYQTEQKMQVAKGLLEEGISIKKVARQCGYRSHSSFTTAFKNWVGQTPVEWKNKRA